MKIKVKTCDPKFRKNLMISQKIQKNLFGNEKFFNNQLNIKKLEKKSFLKHNF